MYDYKIWLIDASWFLLADIFQLSLTFQRCNYLKYKQVDILKLKLKEPCKNTNYSVFYIKVIHKKSKSFVKQLYTLSENLIYDLLWNDGQINNIKMSNDSNVGTRSVNITMSNDS